MIYYVVELENLHSFRKATIVSAKSLRGRKIVGKQKSMLLQYGHRCWSEC